MFHSLFFIRINSDLDTQGAVHDFIQTFVSQEDFTQSILPTMEKALLRSPEYSLNSWSLVYNIMAFTDNTLATTQFFEAYPHPIDSDTFRRLLVLILNCAKSTNVLAREGSVGLFKVLVQKNPTESNIEFAVNELLTLPKARKTGGPDHRTALYSMLSVLTPSLSISLLVASAVPPLVEKETHDGPMSILAATLPLHISFLLHADKPISADITSLLAKEMNNAKPVIRRTFCSLVGDIFWALNDLSSEASQTFVRAIVPSFETSLKTVSANPLNSTAGPLEGYIAMAVLLGPISRSGKFGLTISSSTTPTSLTSVFGRCFHCGQCRRPIIGVYFPQTHIPILG